MSSTLIQKGLDPTDYDDTFTLEKFKRQGIDVSRYTECTGEGCLLPITPPTSSNEKSYAAVLLQAGHPRPIGDYSKLISISLGLAQHEMSST